MTSRDVKSTMMSIMLRTCKVCKKKFTPLRTSGRPACYCYDGACRQEMKRAWWKANDAKRAKLRAKKEDRRIRIVLPETPVLEPKPVTWWVAQAMGIMETCEKCEGPVEGAYIPPTRATMGECAVVAHCRLCGKERMVISGMAGVPYE